VKIAITGSPRSGKTTLVKKILQHTHAVGFYTEEIRRNGRRYGFNIITTWGEKLPLARVGNLSPFKVGKYAVFPENLDTVIENLHNIRESDNIIIDEIGKMELLNINFARWVKDLWRNHKGNIIVTIPIKDVHPIVANIRKTADYLLNLDKEKVQPEELFKLINNY